MAEVRNRKMRCNQNEVGSNWLPVNLLAGESLQLVAAPCLHVSHLLQTFLEQFEKRAEGFPAFSA